MIKKCASCRFKYKGCPSKNYSCSDNGHKLWEAIVNKECKNCKFAIDGVPRILLGCMTCSDITKVSAFKPKEVALVYNTKLEHVGNEMPDGVDDERVVIWTKSSGLSSIADGDYWTWSSSGASKITHYMVLK